MSDVLFEEIDDCDSDEEGELEAESDVTDNISPLATGISESAAKFLYSEAGKKCPDFLSHKLPVTVLPHPLDMLSTEEELITEAKLQLGIKYDLEPFQIQAISVLNILFRYEKYWFKIKCLSRCV